MSIYGSVAGANAYFTARGNAAWTGDDGAKLAALTVASDYIDGRYRYQLYPGGRWKSMFSGVRTAGYGQDREWPRTGATDGEDNAIPDGTTPTPIEYATYEAALIQLTSPGSLTPVYVSTSQVKREKVGPLEVEYVAASSINPLWPPNMSVVPAIDMLVAPFLTSQTCGFAALVV